MYPVIRTATELLASLMVCMASVRAAEPSARVPLRLPDGTELYRVDFDRHVAPSSAGWAATPARVTGRSRVEAGCA